MYGCGPMIRCRRLKADAKVAVGLLGQSAPEDGWKRRYLFQLPAANSSD